MSRLRSRFRMAIAAYVLAVCGANSAHAQLITVSAGTPGSLDTLGMRIITQWNFNFATPSFSPTIGTGTIAAVGGTTLFPDGGAPGPNNTVSNPNSMIAEGFGTAGYGVSFSTSTLPSTNVVIVQFDISSSAAAPGTLNFAYTTDGSSYNSVGNITINTADTFKHVTVDLTNVSGVANNTNFGFELTEVGTTSVSGGAINPSTGQVRLDSITVTTTPEPTSLALAGIVGISGLGGFGWRRWKQRNAANPTTSTAAV